MFKHILFQVLKLNVVILTTPQCYHTSNCGITQRRSYSQHFVIDIIDVNVLIQVQVLRTILMFPCIFVRPQVFVPQSKILLLTFKSLCSLAPPWICNLLEPYNLVKSLHFQLEYLTFPFFLHWYTCIEVPKYQALEFLLYLSSFKMCLKTQSF